MELREEGGLTLNAIQVASATPTIVWMSIVALIRGGILIILIHITGFCVEIWQMEMMYGAMAIKHEDKT
jgi:hypothetical protein